MRMSSSRASHKQLDAQAALCPGVWQALRASVPHLATWDDHDYGRTTPGPTSPKRAGAEGLPAILDVPPSDPRRRREASTRAAFGPTGRRVQVILLDTRFFRSPLKLTETRAHGRSVTSRTRTRRRRCSATSNGRGWPLACESPRTCTSLYRQCRSWPKATDGSAGATYRASASACTTWCAISV